ncbi:rubredoxin [Gammaproteobacteria bacterium]|jgi:rubredoxin|nr:rubredoxin [Gammaproteobacteria bacterium]
MSEQPYQRYQCLICNYVYNEETGDEAEGFAPGTRWADIPDDWFCPDCGATKDDFAVIED